MEDIQYRLYLAYTHIVNVYDIAPGCIPTAGGQPGTSHHPTWGEAPGESGEGGQAGEFLRHTQCWCFFFFFRWGSSRYFGVFDQ